MGKKWDLIVKCVRIKQEPHDSEFDLAEKQSRKHDLYMFFLKKGASLIRGYHVHSTDFVYLCVCFLSSPAHIKCNETSWKDLKIATALKMMQRCMKGWSWTLDWPKFPSLFYFAFLYCCCFYFFVQTKASQQLFCKLLLQTFAGHRWIILTVPWPFM